MKLKTVCGEIGREQLGIVTTHEHVLLDLTAFYSEKPVEGVASPSTQKVEMWTLGILNRDCYALKDNAVSVSYRVSNCGEKTFFFGIGLFVLGLLLYPILMGKKAPK